MICAEISLAAAVAATCVFIGSSWTVNPTAAATTMVAAGSRHPCRGFLVQSAGVLPSQSTPIQPKLCCFGDFSPETSPPSLVPFNKSEWWWWLVGCLC